MQLRYITAISYGKKEIMAPGITQGCMFIKVLMRGADECAGMQQAEYYKASLNVPHIQFILAKNSQASRAEVWTYDLGIGGEETG